MTLPKCHWGFQETVIILCYIKAKQYTKQINNKYQNWCETPDINEKLSKKLLVETEFNSRRISFFFFGRQVSL